MSPQPTKSLVRGERLTLREIFDRYGITYEAVRAVLPSQEARRGPDQAVSDGEPDQAPGADATGARPYGRPDRLSARLHPTGRQLLQGTYLPSAIASVLSRCRMQSAPARE